MKTKNKKTKLRRIMRALHRDVAFITIGFTLIYALSGILLIYRNTDFLKTEKQFEKTLSSGLDIEQVAKELRVRGLVIQKREGDVVYFRQGSYNERTGEAVYTEKVYPKVIDKAVKLHKINGTHKSHWIAVIYGILLSFMAISSLFMFKFSGKNFRRMVIGVSIGVVLVVLAIWTI